MQGGDERRIELQQRFAAGADDKAPGERGIRRPGAGDGGSQLLGGFESAAAGSIEADEVCVAEAADGSGAVGLAPGPEVAARKATEDRRAAGLRAFALEGIEDFLDRVGHKNSSQLSVYSCQSATMLSPRGAT